MNGRNPMLSGFESRLALLRFWWRGAGHASFTAQTGHLSGFFLAVTAATRGRPV
jgi:hypothetical protein